MSFDPMAAAVDWLDAYRAGDIENILGMYADHAEIHCGCDGMKTITDSGGRRTYWAHRLLNHPASSLDNLEPFGEGVIVSYISRGRIFSANLNFDSVGRIVAHVCGRSDYLKLFGAG